MWRFFGTWIVWGHTVHVIMICRFKPRNVKKHNQVHVKSKQSLHNCRLRQYYNYIRFHIICGCIWWANVLTQASRSIKSVNCHSNSVLESMVRIQTLSNHIFGDLFWFFLIRFCFVVFSFLFFFFFFVRMEYWSIKPPFNPKAIAKNKTPKLYLKHLMHMYYHYSNTSLNKLKLWITEFCVFLFA